MSNDLYISYNRYLLNVKKLCSAEATLIGRYMKIRDFNPLFEKPQTNIIIYRHYPWLKRKIC